MPVSTLEFNDMLPAKTLEFACDLLVQLCLLASERYGPVSSSDFHKVEPFGTFIIVQETSRLTMISWVVRRSLIVLCGLQPLLVCVMPSRARPNRAEAFKAFPPLQIETLSRL